MSDIKLTSLAHGGGCGCKIAPAVLAQLLADMPSSEPFSDLLVGADTGDDAAVYRLNDRQAIVATTDFFMPIVDDPFDFGRIAATNALSDVYAMGGRPLLALAVVGMPVGKLPVAAIRQILAGGASVCAEAGIPLAGGHSIDTPEPIYGLVALGMVNPERVKRNNHARADDVLILGKPLGIGILSAALKKGLLDEAGYAAMLRQTTQLNRVGVELAELTGVHAMTDVTGFGLLGHLLEICRGSGVCADIAWADLPLIPQAVELASLGHATGASQRNWDSYGESVRLASRLGDWQRKLLCDPQTSGGLLVACDKAQAPAVLGLFHRQGFTDARLIGRLRKGVGTVNVAG